MSFSCVLPDYSSRFDNRIDGISCDVLRRIVEGVKNLVISLFLSWLLRRCIFYELQIKFFGLTGSQQLQIKPSRLD